MENSVSRAILLVLIMCIAVTATACDGGAFGNIGQSDNPNREYYTGITGLQMRFSNPSDPPSKMYYYAQGAQPGDHDFSVAVDLHNIGASYTRGGLYVSGYDPYLVHIDGIDVPRLNQGWGDCDLDFGVGNIQGASFWEMLSATVNCEGVGTGAHYEGPDSFGFHSDSLGDSLGPVLDKIGVSRDVLDDISISYENRGGSNFVDFSFADDFAFDALNHGKGLLMMLKGLSFDRYNGKEFILAPDDPNYPGGEMDTFVFEGELKRWMKGVDKRDLTFMVTSCYLYSTHASPMVCIDPAPMSEGRKVCHPREITFNGGNGAPVAITRVEQENTRRSIYFDIHVENLGNGDVIDMGKIEKCSPYYPADLSSRYKDKVYLIDVRIGGQHLECSPDRIDGVKLIPGQGGYVRCRYDLEYVTAKSAYETPLVIELGYGYSETMIRRTMVKRV
ncbi:MAG: hypothetical protein ACOCU6_01325 [Nanoarchaeota archaeon]